MDETAEEASRYVVASVDAALKVLKIVSNQSGIGLVDVAKAAELNKSRTMRLLVTLEAHGLVSKSHRGEYTLGLAAVALGNRAKEMLGWPDLVQPILDRLRDDTGETVQYRVMNGMQTVCILGSESRHDVRVHMETGRPRDLHIGSSKSILAFGAPELLERVLQSSPVAFTERTAVDRKALELQLAESRKRGYSISQGERIKGAFAMGAPVYNTDGSVTSCISLLGPEFRMTTRLDELSPLLLNAAQDVSSVVGEYGTP